ncbi:Transposase IS4 [Popillia japonica]|uniref:Transposase IS4 n=1 Tax=Popillia japonica TaxID=7064 RepID=A0AAW1LAZ9_POPJA
MLVVIKPMKILVKESLVNLNNLPRTQLQASGEINLHHEESQFCATSLHLINLHNANMGGVDRCDQNLTLYRISLRGKKRYFSVVTHCIDMAVYSAWQMQCGADLDQLKFRTRIATMLFLQNAKHTTSRGHISRNEDVDIRFHRMDYFVIPQNKQARYAYCHEAYH